jgi:hypothetical protein
LKSPVGVVSWLLVVDSVLETDELVDGVGPVEGLLRALLAVVFVTGAVTGWLGWSELGSLGTPGDGAVKAGHVHFVLGVLSLPEPGTDALSVRALWHTSWDFEFGLKSLDALSVDGEDGKVFWLDIVGIALVGNGETASKKLAVVERVAGVHRFDVNGARVRSRVAGFHAGELSTTREFGNRCSASWELEGLGSSLWWLVEISVEPPFVEGLALQRSHWFVTVRGC